MKGLILSGGRGVRLRPITYSQQKHLIPIANKTMLFYTIEDLIESGITDIGIIVGFNREQIEEKVRSVKWQADIRFIYQEYPGGLAHAVKEAHEFLKDDKFIMYLGDNLLKGGCSRFVQGFAGSQADSSLLLTTTEFPERYGIALVDEQKKVINKLVEKPKVPMSNLIVVGIYGFTPLIFEAITNIKPSWRNELEITDAIQWLIDNNYTVEYEMVEGWWKDTGRPEDILDANRLVFNDLELIIKSEPKDCKTYGKLGIGENSVVENSTIKGPAIIGDNCRISDAYIGPYTSIGDSCQILNSEVEDSIIMEGTKIVNIRRVVESLIGKEVKVEIADSLPKGVRMIIGDNSEVKL